MRTWQAPRTWQGWMIEKDDGDSYVTLDRVEALNLTERNGYAVTPVVMAEIISLPTSTKTEGVKELLDEDEA